jgi:copper chaperone
MERTELKIKGMTCDNCVQSVTEALKAVDGVKMAKVSLADETAQVTFDPKSATRDQLKAAIQNAGYDVA